MQLGLGSTACLAVARLDELTPASSHRYRDGQPLHGFCLLNGDHGHYRVTLHIENGRTLSDQSGQGGFYYEGWLIGPDGPTSLGAFSLGPHGQGSSTRVIAGSLIQAARSDLVRVTAEPYAGEPAESIAVLEGRLVWLETEPNLPEPVLQGLAGGGVGDWQRHTPTHVEASRAAQGLATTAGAEVAEPEAADPSAAEVRAVGLEVSERPLVQAHGGPTVMEAHVAPSVEAGAGPTVEASAVGDHPAELLQEMADAAVAALEVSRFETADPGAEPAEQGAAGQGLSGQVEPRFVNPLALPVQLVQRHPMAPRAAGTATLNLRQGSVIMNLRGLPSPTALGRDRTTGRPFNTYRVWLVSQETGIRTPVGFCERAWGENFRFQADGLPLNRNDTLLITAEDRTAAAANHASPQVLIGSYSA